MNQKYKNFTFSKNWLIYLIPLPFLVNFLFNLIENGNTIAFLSARNLLFSFLSFLFLYYFCSLIAQSLKLKNISLCICIFYISFYVVNYSTLFLNKRFQSFGNYFYFTIILWIIFLLYNFKILNKKNLFLSLFLFSTINLIKDSIFMRDYKVIQFSSDPEYFWTPMSKAIYDTGLFFALENNIISGYGLLINYIHAINFKLFINEENFYFHTSTTNIFLFLSILFIWEIETSNLIKYSSLIIFLSILLNSDWLSYLFINSSMGEGVLNYIFAPIFFALINLIKKDNFSLLQSYIILLIAGFLYFTKPFASYLILLALFIFFLNNRKFSFLFFGFFGFFINILNYSFVVFSNTTDGYLNTSEFSNTENLLNLKIQNIFQIFINFYTLDKVITLFIVILAYVSIYNIYKLKSLSPLVLIIGTNAFLVFALYISIWQNKELESAYRYLLSFFNLYFVLYIDELNNFAYRDKA